MQFDEISGINFDYFSIQLQDIRYLKNIWFYVFVNLILKWFEIILEWTFLFSFTCVYTIFFLDFPIFQCYEKMLWKSCSKRMSPHFEKMLWKITLLQVSKKSDRYVKNQEINRKERDSNISIFSQANVKQKLILT